MTITPIFYFKNYKVRLYPNKQQEILFEKNVGCCRFVYNKALDLQIKTYETTGKKLSAFSIIKKLPNLIKNYPWLAEADIQSLRFSIINLDNAYKHFFRRAKQGEASGFPKFKKKGQCRNSFKCSQTLAIKKNNLRIGKHGWIKSSNNLEYLSGVKIKNISVIKEADKWFASCCVEVEKCESINHKYEECGIDVGVKKTISNCLSK